MAGLADQVRRGPPSNAAQGGQQGPQSQPVGGMMPTNQQGQMGVDAASPEEQQIAEVFMANVAEWFYGEGYEFIVQELSQGDPMRQAGKVAAKTMLEQEQFAEIGGKQIPNSIKLDLGSQIVEELFVIMEKEGIAQFEGQEEQQKMTEALMYATEFWGANALASGRVTPDEREQLGQALNSGQYDHINLTGAGDGTA